MADHAPLPFKNKEFEGSFLADMKNLLRDRCLIDQETLTLYGKDYSYHGSANPQLVVLPNNQAEVVEVVKLCNAHKVAVIPYGSGTSLEGHTTAAQGGVCISMRNMSKLIAVHPKGLMPRMIDHSSLPSYMSANSAGNLISIGGMTSTCASGTKAVRYGTMKNNVLSVKVVLADGRIIKTGNRSRKSSAGYDLTHLFVGSEGTLGIVTEITLRVYRIPEFVAAALVNFPTIVAAANAVEELMQKDLPLGMVELLDDLMMKALNKRFKLHYAEEPTLYLEFTGWSQAVINEQEQIVRRVTQKYGGGTFHYATTAEAREELWKARKSALFASTVLKPGSEILTTDVCVPISNLPQCIKETHEDLKASPLLAPLVGHVGDGNFHLFILLDPNNKEDVAEAKRLNSKLIARAIAMDGTCTGEHGVGVGKRNFLIAELGQEAIELMWQIKCSLDPNLIMNPGKVFPDSIVQKFKPSHNSSPNISVSQQGVTNIQLTKGQRFDLHITFEEPPIAKL